MTNNEELLKNIQEISDILKFPVIILSQYNDELDAEMQLIENNDDIKLLYILGIDNKPQIRLYDFDTYPIYNFISDMGGWEDEDFDGDDELTGETSRSLSITFEVHKNNFDEFYEELKLLLKNFHLMPTTRKSDYVFNSIDPFIEENQPKETIIESVGETLHLKHIPYYRWNGYVNLSEKSLLEAQLFLQQTLPTRMKDNWFDILFYSDRLLMYNPNDNIYLKIHISKPHHNNENYYITLSDIIAYYTPHSKHHLIYSLWFSKYFNDIFMDHIYNYMHYNKIKFNLCSDKITIERQIEFETYNSSSYH